MAEQRPHSEKTHSDDPNLADDPTAELVAYLDGELEHAASAVVEGKISLDATVRAEVDSLKKTWDLLDYLPRQDPSPNFTERTVSQLEPIKKSPATSAPTLPAAAKSNATSKPVRASTVAEPVVSPPRSTVRRLVGVAAWLLVFGLAGSAGYFGHALFVGRFLSPMDQQEKDAKILAESRLLQNLSRYRYVDDLEFVKSLDQSELFGEEQSAPLSEGAEMKSLGCILLAGGILGTALATGPDAADVQSLRRQYAYFQSLPPARQQQIRTLDHELIALDQETQERLRKVMDNYNEWLSHLSEGDRSRVIDAPTAAARLDVIRDLKDREWLKTLPQKYREKYASTTPAEQSNLLKDWRIEEQLRRDEWQFVRRHWKDLQDDVSPLLPQGPEFREQLEKFVQNLSTQLPADQRDRLFKTRTRAQEQRTWVNWIAYLNMAADLADRYTLLPGPPDGPRNYEALPKADIAALERKKIKQAKDHPIGQNAQGRWPDYALAVTNYAAKYNVKLPEPLGPTNKTAMPPEVRTFIEKDLEPALRKTDLTRLHDAEGKWPEYPRAVMDLARIYRLYMPGWMLPGRPEFWERLPMKTPKK